MAIRILIGLFVLLLVCFYLGYGLADRRSDRVLTVQRQLWEDELSQRTAGLKTALERARTESVPVKLPSPSEFETGLSPVLPSPAEALDELLRIRMPEGEARRQVTRRVVFLLETLAVHREKSLPLIEAFLSLNQDVEYAPPATGRLPLRDRAGPNRRGAGRGLPSQSDQRGPLLATEFVLPPSLRLGLFSVVRDIALPASETILAEAVGRAGRGVELAVLADHLEDLAPGRHREPILSAVRELLSHPLDINSPTRLDDLSRGYLFAVLERFGDRGYRDEALKQVLGEENRMIPAVVRYLVSLVGEEALPGLVKIYREATIPDRWDRLVLGMEILQFSGKNGSADELFGMIAANDGDAAARALLVCSLVGGEVGPYQLKTIDDAAVIARRLGLVEAALKQVDTPQMVEALEHTRSNLKNLLAGKEPVAFVPLRNRPRRSLAP